MFIHHKKTAVGLWNCWKMEQFILRYSWFALNYILRILGLNLLKRDGEAGLRQTSVCQFWLPLAGTYFVIHGSIIAIYCYIFNFETTYEEFLRVGKEKITNSTTTSFAIYSSIIMTYGIFFIGVFKLRTLSKGLIGTQIYFNQYALINERVTKKAMRQFLWRAFPYMAIISIGSSLGVIGLTKLSFSSLNVSTFWVNILTISCILIFLVCNGPVWYFAFIYSEVIIILIKKLAFILNNYQSRY